MATPIYKGKGQPSVDDGWLSGLAGVFGGSTPAYRGDGQPSSRSAYFSGTAPAYKSAPAAASDAARDDDPQVIERVYVVPCGVSDPQQ